MNGLQFHKKGYLLHTKYNALPHYPPTPSSPTSLLTTVLITTREGSGAKIHNLYLSHERKKYLHMKYLKCLINLGIKVKGTKMKQENIRADNCTSKALPWFRLVHIQHQVLVSISHKEPHLCVIQQELTCVNLWWTEILQKSIWEDSVISKKMKTFDFVIEWYCYIIHILQG